MEISWPHPLVLQIIIIMITPDGGNSQRAFTSGLPLRVPEPSGLAELVWPLLFPPHFVAEDPEARGGGGRLGHAPGLGAGLQPQLSLPAQLGAPSWALEAQGPRSVAQERILL